MNLRTLPIAAAMALAVLGCPLPAAAESARASNNGSITGGAGANTSARAYFQVNIPKALSLRVGAGAVGAPGTMPAGVATINQIWFQPTTAQLGYGATVSATAGSGDVGNGTVTVQVSANPGTDVVNLTYRTTDSAGAARAALTDANNNTIPWSTIKVATAGADAATLAHPASLADGSAADVNVIAPMAKVNGFINLTATWTYTWNDGGLAFPVSAAGGYTGRVAYKLATP